MEISNYYVPVTLILPMIAILGILFVTLAMTYVMRRRRKRKREQSEAGQNSSAASSAGRKSE